MRPIALEARVIAAVEARRSGVSPEDDFTECKARWPEKTTARQLAGLANKAAGEPVVYIIGLHDKTGATTDPGNLDPSDWWAGMRGQFDQTPPDQLLHLLVAVGDGEYVHAFAFDTSRAPYVVKDGVKLDVPIRDGTGTRSAHRHELLRMLLPSLSAPPLTVLSGRLTATWHSAVEPEFSDGRSNPGRQEGISLTGTIRCFIEHTAASYLMLPAHGMQGTVRIGDWSGDLTVRVNSTQKDRPTSTYGVEMRHDGLVATGPGAFAVWMDASIPLHQMSSLGTAEEAHVELALQVAGSNRPLLCGARLIGSTHRMFVSEHFRELAVFSVPEEF